jgi:hypothetical protein
MAITHNSAIKKAEADAQIALYNGGFLRFYASAPSGAGNAPGGALLAEGVLPNPAFAAASAASPSVAAKTGVWQATGQAAAGAGTAAQSFRLVSADGTKVTEGSVTVTGGGGDMTLDNVSIANTQVITVSAYTHTQN